MMVKFLKCLSESYLITLNIYDYREYKFCYLCMALNLCTKLSVFTVRKVFYLYIFKIYIIFGMVKPYTILNLSCRLPLNGTRISIYTYILSIFFAIQKLSTRSLSNFSCNYTLFYQLIKTIARTRKLNPENYRFLSPQNDDISHIINIQTVVFFRTT